MLTSKLSPKANRKCAHLVHDCTITYGNLKHFILKNVSHNPEQLANIIHGLQGSEFKDKSELDKILLTRSIVKQYLLDADPNNITGFITVRAYKQYADKRFSKEIKLSNNPSVDTLIDLAAIFDSQADYEENKYEKSYRKQHPSRPFCTYCRKAGHTEPECFRKQNIARTDYHKPDHFRQDFYHSKPDGHRQDLNYYKTDNSRQDTPRQDPYKTGGYQQQSKPKCQDNKKPYPKGNREQYKDADVKKHPVRVNWNQTTTTNNSIKGKVNGHQADIIIDTGAQITVVPGNFVYTDDLTDDIVYILGVNGNPIPYQTARIPITLRDKAVFETVAVAPADQLKSKVLLSTPVNSNTVDHLVNSYLAKQSSDSEYLTDSTISSPTKHVNHVKRHKRKVNAEVKYFSEDDDSMNEDVRASDSSYEPDTDTDDSAASDLSDGEVYLTNQQDILHLPEPVPQTLNPVFQSLEPIPQFPEIDKPISSPSESNSQPIQPEPFGSEPTETESLDSQSGDPESPTPLVQNQQTANPDCQTLTLPTFPTLNKSNIENLRAETKSDPSLKVIRGLAHHDRNGYSWDKGLIYHSTIDSTLGSRSRLVVPKSYRENLMKIAHDNLGHFSHRKTKSILNSRFTWPNMGAELADYILACIPCKKYNNMAHKQAPLHYRPTISEPYEEIALDVIGPFPRSKQGYRYALTAICMASRWPEVYPLATSDTESIANALVQFMARNGIPLKILTEQGTQFMSHVISQTCEMLGISHITTVPCRPQGNGVLERFHGTLKPLLAKASNDGIDWVSSLPLALSAIRAIPCRSTGFSPAELVFGRNPRNFLDILYEGWSNPSYNPVDIQTWVSKLQDKLESLRDSATLTNHSKKVKQNSYKATSRTARKYKAGELVFTRIPGCRAVL